MFKNETVIMPNPKLNEKENYAEESYDNIQDVYKLEKIKFKPIKIDVDKINEEGIKNKPPILHIPDIGKTIWRIIPSPLILVNLNQVVFNIMVPSAPTNSDRNRHLNRELFVNESPNSIQFINSNFE